MKKAYLPCEIEIVLLETVDVLTASDPTNPEFNPENGGHNSSGWT